MEKKKEKMKKYVENKKVKFFDFFKKFIDSWKEWDGMEWNINNIYNNNNNKII